MDTRFKGHESLIYEYRRKEQGREAQIIYFSLFSIVLAVNNLKHKLETQKTEVNCPNSAQSMYMKIT